MLGRRTPTPGRPAVSVHSMPLHRQLDSELCTGMTHWQAQAQARPERLVSANVTVTVTRNLYGAAPAERSEARDCSVPSPSRNVQAAGHWQVGRLCQPAIFSALPLSSAEQKVLTGPGSGPDFGPRCTFSPFVRSAQSEVELVWLSIRPFILRLCLRTLFQ